MHQVQSAFSSNRANLALRCWSRPCKFRGLVVKIMVLLLGTLHVRGRIIIGTQKRDHNFDNHPKVCKPFPAAANSTGPGLLHRRREVPRWMPWGLSMYVSVRTRNRNPTVDLSPPPNPKPGT